MSNVILDRHLTRQPSSLLFLCFFFFNNVPVLEFTRNLYIQCTILYILCALNRKLKHIQCFFNASIYYFLLTDKILLLLLSLQHVRRRLVTWFACSV